jgi:hypothetical protein
MGSEPGLQPADLLRVDRGKKLAIDVRGFVFGLPVAASTNLRDSAAEPLPGTFRRGNDHVPYTEFASVIAAHGPNAIIDHIAFILFLL